MNPVHRLALLALLLLSACQTVQEMPPQLSDSRSNAGRTQAVTVNPTRSDQFIIATQFGGLWKSDNHGANWKHLDGLNYVFVNDVQFGRDGKTVVATVGRSNQVDHPGGIWVSRDRGETWVRPPTAAPPAYWRLPERMQAYGIDNSPNDPLTWFVGTDQGVAVSHDYGSSWSHHLLGTTSDAIDSDRFQNRVQSVVALSVYTVSR